MKRDSKTGLEIVSEAIQLLRTTPSAVIAAYFAGTIPFVAGGLFFWADMSASAFARERIHTASLGLAALFIWMKCWQAVFADGLAATAGNRPRKRWGFSRILRTVAVQTALQPYGLVAMPVAISLMAPLHLVNGFFQNLLVYGAGETASPGEAARKAWRQANLWPGQNWMIMWLLSPWLLAAGLTVAFLSTRIVVAFYPELYDLSGLVWFYLATLMIVITALPLSPFGCVVAGNIAFCVFAAPGLVHALVGGANAFQFAGPNAVFNTTFIATVFGISYLCLDPLIKAAYVLRCYYGASLTTGEDIRAELREKPEA